VWLCVEITDDMSHSTRNIYVSTVYLVLIGTMLAACDVSAPPVNIGIGGGVGGVGNCGSTVTLPANAFSPVYPSTYLASSQTCQPTCTTGYTVSGVTRCYLGVTTAATCLPNRKC